MRTYLLALEIRLEVCRQHVFFTAQRSALVTEEVVCTVRLIVSNGKLSWHSFNFKLTLLNQNNQTLSQRKTITRILFAFV